MSAWLDANADGIAMMFWACVAGLIALGIAGVYERRLERRRRRITRIERHCERVGSQAEFYRRLRSGGGR